MVSMSLNRGGIHSHFNIDKLLDNKSQVMTSPVGTECQPSNDSAFKTLRTCGRPDNNPAVTEGLVQPCTFMSNGLGLQPASSDQPCFHRHRESTELCSQCYQSPPSHVHDNLLHSMRSYDMSTQSVSSLNNNNTCNFMRSAGIQNSSPSPWPLLETSPHTADLHPHDIRTHRSLGSYGLKFRSNFMKIDSLSNISNISNIPNIASMPTTYSPFSNFYSTMGQSQLGTQLGASGMDHGVGVTGHGFPWVSSRAAGFLSSRCAGKSRNIISTPVFINFVAVFLIETERKKPFHYLISQKLYNENNCIKYERFSLLILYTHI